MGEVRIRVRAEGKGARNVCTLHYKLKKMILRKRKRLLLHTQMENEKRMKMKRCSEG